MLGLAVTVVPVDEQFELPYAGITDWTWPAGFTIEVDTVLGDSVFHSLPDLAEALQFRYYLPGSLRDTDSLWRKAVQTPTGWYAYPQYCFLFTLPPTLAGHALRLRVQYQHPLYGALSATDSMMVTAPCSAGDLERSRYSYVGFALKAQEYQRGIALADSFIALGWRSQWGLTDASHCASRIGDYAAAIYYLDLCYQTHRDVGIHVDTDPNDTTGARVFYEFWRALLVDSLN